MRKILLMLLSIVLLSGCNPEDSLSYTEVSKESLNKDFKLFYQGIKEENGVHLYFDKQNEALLVYLNGSFVVQGEKAINFTGFDVEGNNDTLSLFYKSNETSDYTNSSLRHELLYRVNLHKDYEVVRLFNNGRETSFGTVSGNSVISILNFR